MKSIKSLSETLEDLRKKGYEADFKPQSDCLYCNSLDLRLYEEEFHIDEVFQFEGDSYAEANIFLYALTSPTGVKGTVVDVYGPSIDTLRIEGNRTNTWE